MQNPITFLPTEPTGKAAQQVKNSNNSGVGTSNSFKQVLSKEISEKQNSVQEKPANRVEDKIEDKTSLQDIKNNVSSQPTRIEPVAEDDSKNDAVPLETAQINGVQLIALVESLAQFSPKVIEKAVPATSAEVASIEASAANLALSKTVEKTDLNSGKVNPKTDPNVLTQNKFEVISQKFSENTSIAAASNNLDPASSAEQLIAATLKGNDVKPEKLAQSIASAGIENSTELKTSLQDVLKTNVQTDRKVNFRDEIKPDLKSNLIVDMKPEPKATLKIDLNTNLNTNLNTDLKVDLKGDLKTDFKIEPRVDSAMDPNVDPIVDLKAEPKNALKTDLKTELKIDPKVDAKADLIVSLNTNLKIDLKADRQIEVKIEPRVDSKIDPKVDLKSDPIVNLNVDSKVNLKIEVKTDLKTQDSGNIKEQSVKIAEVSPSAQNYAQQVSVNNAQINAAVEVEHIAPRVGTPAWNQSVGQKIVWMVAGGQQTAELTLNPPDLGPMQVVLSVNNDQANATFISAHPDVRDALESAMPKLRQMMSDAGVQLSGFSVKSESSNPGAQFSGDRSPSRSKNNEQQSVVGNTAIVGTSTPMKNSTGNGIVDTFA